MTDVTTEACLVEEEEEVEPFSKTYDLADPEARERASIDLRNWGRLHTRKAYYDPETRILTLHFQPAADRRWAEWEATRKALILDDSR